MMLRRQNPSVVFGMSSNRPLPRFTLVKKPSRRQAKRQQVAELETSPADSRLILRPLMRLEPDTIKLDLARGLQIDLLKRAPDNPLQP